MASNYKPTAKDTAHRKEVQKLKSTIFKQYQEICELKKQLNTIVSQFGEVQKNYEQLLECHNIKGEQFEKYLKDTQSLCNTLKLLGILGR